MDNCSGLTSQVKIKPKTWWIPGVLRPFAVRAVVDCCPANGQCNMFSVPCDPSSRSGVQCRGITSLTGGPSLGIACGCVRLRGYGSCVLSSGFILLCVSLIGGHFLPGPHVDLLICCVPAGRLGGVLVGQVPLSFFSLYVSLTFSEA